MNTFDGVATGEETKSSSESLKIVLNRTFRLIPDMFNKEILACVRYVVRTRVRIPPGPLWIDFEGLIEHTKQHHRKPSYRARQDLDGQLK